MDEQHDQLLMPEGVKGLSTILAQPLDFEIVKKFTSISDRMLDRVAAYLQLIWFVRAEKEGNKDFSEGITSIKDVLYNIKYKFHIEYKFKDLFWMRDCAGTLREIIDGLTPDDLHKAFKNIDIQKESPKLGAILKTWYFLSEVAHFRIKSAQPKIIELLGSKEIIGTADYSDDDFKQNFEVVCIKLIYMLHSIFEDYCYERDN